MSFKMKRHSSAYKHHKDVVHIKRKLEIVKNMYAPLDVGYKALHQSHRLSKGKLHCSCPMCTDKVKNRGWKHSDEKKRLICDYEDIDIGNALESHCLVDSLVYSTN